MEQQEGVKEKVEGRYVEGGRRITSAPKVTLEPIETTKGKKKKKNFGGKGGPSGNKMKGIKNAKRQASFQ